MSYSIDPRVQHRTGKSLSQVPVKTPEEQWADKHDPLTGAVRVVGAPAINEDGLVFEDDEFGGPCSCGDCEECDILRSELEPDDDSDELR